MSKSAGSAVSPVDLAREYGSDALRYFLLREVSWGADGEFSIERLEERFAADLANTLGNLLHRTLTMIEKFCGGVIPERSGLDYAPEGDTIHSVGALEILLAARRSQAAGAYDALDFARALEQTLDIARQANQRIDALAPWKLVKEPTGEGRKVVQDLLNLLAEALKNMAVLLAPVLPGKAREMWLALGLEEAELDAVRIAIPGEGQRSAADQEELHPGRAFASVDAVTVEGRTVRKGGTLFPRRDAKPS